VTLESWGQLPARPAREERWWSQRGAALPAADMPLLAYGNGRSYGDVGLNAGGILLHTRGIDRFIAFDEETGVLTCEAGVLLSEIIDHFVPRGWFLPVTPGTRFVTVGGAIANDVHSKNHHRAGTFGCHVRCFELLRSDGSRRVCSRLENSEWFAATVGGLGLTGLVTWAEIALNRIDGVAIEVQATRFGGLAEFFAINGEAEARHEYTVAWIDCLAAKPRGILLAGDHVASTAPGLPKAPRTLPLSPPRLPFSLINSLSLRAFNLAYYHWRLAAKSRVHFKTFLYPLDIVSNWNWLYGKAGFYQYQFVLPMASREALVPILDEIARSGQGSFLAVLKTFGEKTSPGLLSFPMPGVTLALDFPNLGERTLALFDRLDAIVASAGGRLYAAKDARMRGEFFRASYPRLVEFLAYIDPKFSSDFSRRLLW
jgi:FAD/FMN-containing dehydrogenase